MINDKIVVKGARVNNLKNIDITIPRNKLVIMTGLSGSGKTSLAFDTIYAEGQRRYVESLSSYARQFLGGIEKPDVDSIEGLSPSISIDQKTTSNNPRSTVGTITEIYDYLRLLYARCGEAYCPNHHQKIAGTTITNIVTKVMNYEDDLRLEILAGLVNNQKGTFKELIKKLKEDGFLRAYIDDELILLEEVEQLNKNNKHTIKVVVDRLKKKDGIESRLYDAVEIATKLTDGMVEVKAADNFELFSTNHACPICGFSVPKLEPSFFSFNSPLGACEHCKGLGVTQSINIDSLIPDGKLSINQGGIRYYKNTVNTGNLEWQTFARLCQEYHIDLDKPLNKFSPKELKIILRGSDKPINYQLVSDAGTKYDRHEYIEGVASLIERRAFETTSEFFKDYYFSYLTDSTCNVCGGARLNDKALSVRLGALNIYEFTKLSIKDAYQYIKDLELDNYHAQIAKLLLEDLTKRLKFLVDVGLEYLSLNRLAGTLSGGEAQRIRLATQIGSALTGVLYVLDEPSIGLHQKDNDRLIETLKKMRDLGNSLIVVEHDEDTMRASDYIVDVGPGAGKNGGEIVACGSPEEIMNNPKSLTGAYLSHRKIIDYPKIRSKGNGKYLKIVGASENNLKNIDVKIPLNTLTCVSGVSGSGKSSLVNEVLAKAVMKHLDRVRIKPGAHKKIIGLDNIDKIVAISQDPIGRTPRSNPATYTGVFDDIRELFSMTNSAKEKGYDKGRFSFNVKGGRCEACQGDGVKKISMLFVPDVYVECEECHGKRYNQETLSVTYKEKTIYDILKMSVQDALKFFENHYRIKNKLQTLYDVGLGYLELGQSALTLSGGEAQRIKLASELQKKATGKTIFILDEPTTGLHSEDVRKLIEVLRRIVDNKDTVVVIEHNLDVLKNADYLIDLGPNGGEGGGMLVACGTPEEVAKSPESFTAGYLKRVLERVYE